MDFAFRCFAFVLICPWLAAAGDLRLASEEKARIEADLGIALTPRLESDLVRIVMPDTSEEWRRAAAQRIEAHRKAELNLQFLDRDGRPVVGLDVGIRLLRKDFIFGGVMNLKRFSGQVEMGLSKERYRELFLKFFDASGLDNGLKPKLRRGNEALLPDYFAWCEAVGLQSRGHALIWPGEKHLPKSINALVDRFELAQEAGDAAGADKAKQELALAVESMIREWASRWPVYEWDVYNEPVTNHRIQEILGEGEAANWFRYARESAANPDARLLLNDFQILSAPSEGKTYGRRSPRFRSYLDRLIAAEAPLDAIGFQSRYKWERMDPALVFERMQEYARAYQLPMAGTEFHIPDREGVFEPSPLLRAQMTEELMTLYFSHPQFYALNCWSFVDHRPEQASLIDAEGEISLHGLVWYYLNRIRYDTRSDMLTDEEGRISLSAFLGTYALEVKGEGEVKKLTVIHASPEVRQIVFEER